MKKLMRILLVAMLCLGLCSCGKKDDRTVELMELVENQCYDEAHELLNQMAGAEGTTWVPDDGKDDDFMAEVDKPEDAQVQVQPTDEPEEPKEIPIEGIKLSATELQMTTLDNAEMEAGVYPENTTEYPGSITWSSSDEAIVKVSASSGKLQAIGNGIAIITATMGEHTATCTVTVTNPTIATAEELLAIEVFKRDVVYEIVADIDMAGISEPEKKAYIEGTLEGNGHRIYNLGYGPLFASTEGNGTIRNLTIECDVTVVNQEENSSVRFAAFVGSNNGLIERCVSKGSVTLATDVMYAGGIAVNSDGKVYRCVNEIDFTFGGKIINPLGAERESHSVLGGGIVSLGNVSECYNLGDATFVMGNARHFGGIAYEPRTIENCYNLGTITNGLYAGGICATCFGNIEKCVNYGETETGVTGGHHGGYLIDCYYLKSKSAKGAFKEGFEGGENSSRVRAYGLTDAEALLQESYQALDFENVWVMSEDGYPILKWQLE